MALYLTPSIPISSSTNVYLICIKAFSWRVLRPTFLLFVSFLFLFLYFHCLSGLAICHLTFLFVLKGVCGLVRLFLVFSHFFYHSVHKLYCFLSTTLTTLHHLAVDFISPTLLNTLNMTSPFLDDLPSIISMLITISSTPSFRCSSKKRSPHDKRVGISVVIILFIAPTYPNISSIRVTRPVWRTYTCVPAPIVILLKSIEIPSRVEVSR